MDASRRLRLVLLGVATLALAVAAWFAWQAVGRLGQARSDAASARAELTQLLGRIAARPEVAA